jgi:hypothetical protein
MRLDTSHLLQKAELSKEDSDQHTKKHFYAREKVNGLPEFKFQNHLINIKELDHAILKEELAAVEAKEHNRLNAEKRAQQDS